MWGEPNKTGSLFEIVLMEVDAKRISWDQIIQHYMCGTLFLSVLIQTRTRCITVYLNVPLKNVILPHNILENKEFSQILTS